VETNKKFTLEELKQFDGLDGRPAYVVLGGQVFDVSASKLWRQGRHMGSHQAGRDMTQEITAAPHGPEKINNFQKVGSLIAYDRGKEEIPPFLARLFHTVPLLRRHPHPMLVHFPIVLMMATTGFAILYLLTGNSSFENTSWYCLWGGTLFLFPAIASGLFTWWINYESEWLRAIKIKISLSSLLLVISLSALVWRFFYPDILLHWQPLSLLYCVLIFSLTPLVAAIGWYGATLSFPLTEA
jgi:predicted heme/steroid binding protein/uncharacterized membrane protein